MDRDSRRYHHQRSCWASLSTKGIKVIGMTSRLLVQSFCNWDLVLSLDGKLVRFLMCACWLWPWRSCWDSLSTKGIKVIGTALGLLVQSLRPWDLVLSLDGRLMRFLMRCVGVWIWWAETRSTRMGWKNTLLWRPPWAWLTSGTYTPVCCKEAA